MPKASPFLITRDDKPGQTFASIEEAMGKDQVATVSRYSLVRTDTLRRVVTFKPVSEKQAQAPDEWPETQMAPEPKWGEPETQRPDDPPPMGEEQHQEEIQPPPAAAPETSSLGDDIPF